MYITKERMNLLDLNDTFRLCRLKKQENFLNKIKESQLKHRNKGKWNLLESDRYLDLRNQIILDIPFRAFERKFYRFKTWFETEVIQKYNLNDGEYFIHGRTKDLGRISNIYQVPFMHLEIRDGEIEILHLPRKTKRRFKKHGKDLAHIGKPYKCYLVFKDLQDCSI